MDADGVWTLAPAFDLTLATYPLASGFRAARVNGKASEIHAKNLIRLGREHDVGNPAEIIARVVDSVANWNRHALKHGISSGTAAIVERQHRLLRA